MLPAEVRGLCPDAVVHLGRVPFVQHLPDDACYVPGLTGGCQHTRAMATHDAWMKGRA